MAVVEWERREHIALVTLNRPEARNAINPEVSQTMVRILDEIETDARSPTAHWIRQHKKVPVEPIQRLSWFRAQSAHSTWPR